MTFEQVFKDYSIKYMPNNEQYKMTCVFRENHSSIGSAGGGEKSLFITPGINAYHCFSCKAHGSLISLLTVRMGVPLYDALDLVGTAHIESVFKEKEEATLYQHDLMIEFEAPEQFLKRGFNARFLKRRGVGITEYDNQRMAAIPWHDYKGENIVALKLRGKGRNFLYYPKKFAKSRYLYNYHNCVGHSSAHVVEGETDTWQTQLNGTPNVCAIGGGSLTEEQALLLSTFEEINLAFDNDAAGYKNVELANLKCSPYTNNINVVMFDKNDPGMLNKLEWVKAVQGRMPYAEYALLMTLQHGDAYLKIQQEARKQHEKDVDAKLKFGK